MRKVFLLLMIIFLVGCKTKIEVPDFTSMNFNEAVIWSMENGVQLEYVYEYNNDVEKYEIYYQNVEVGSFVETESVITIHYSKGFDPKTEVDIPNFENLTREEILSWLTESNITNVVISDVYSDQVEGSLIGYDIQKKEERDFYIVGDKYTFEFSKGELMIEILDFSEHKWRGVNLGGWFVLEGWMTPDLFSGVNGSDETVFLQQKHNAEEALIEHWDTFITEEDFAWLSDKGIEYVRLPIPWWLYGVHAYEGKDYEVTYLRSVEYIDRALSWADMYGIKVLLDLHTAPGGQNGFDNGGLTDIQTWGKNEEETGYVQTTIDVLVEITNEFSHHESVWGIEVLNEPSWGVNLDVLRDFYDRSYLAIREINPDIVIGFHDGFRAYDYKWENFFSDKENVFFDMHIYSVFTDELKPFTIQEHLDYVNDTHLEMIKRYEGIVPVVIGEWSYALPGAAYGDSDAANREIISKAYGFKQMHVYDQGAGWFFWNYKIDRSSHFEWDFRRLYDAGYTPDMFQIK